MGPRALIPAIATLFLACGQGTEIGRSTAPGADAGAGAPSTGTGGASGPTGTGGSGGVTSAGGRSTAGSGGSSSAGKTGAGGAAIDCSNVGCGAPPPCGQPCGAPCGCCPCAEGETNGITICVGGCYAPITDSSVGCNPAAEVNRRKYMGTSPASCQAIRFACPANTTMFSNSCGCGCEQKASCPEWFSCEPGTTPPCDMQQIKTDCPYSAIVS